MKVDFNFETYKGICLSLAEEIKALKPDVLVAIPRKGLFSTSIICDVLKLDVAYYFPSTRTLYFPPHLDGSKLKTLVFIDDSVSPYGRTYKGLKEVMSGLPFKWYFVPVIVDDRVDIEEDEHFFIWGMKLRQNPWFVFPNEVEGWPEGDSSLFRNRKLSASKEME